jgi:hypothetical protein
LLHVADARQSRIMARSSASSIHGDLNSRQLALIHQALNKPNARYTVESHRPPRVSYEAARSDLVRLAGLKLLSQRKAGKAYVFVAADDLRRLLRARRS